MKMQHFFSLPLVLACSLMLIGCSTPPVQYYSLTGQPTVAADAASVSVGAPGATAGALAQAASSLTEDKASNAEGQPVLPLAIQVLYVEVPAQVERSQIVLSKPPSTEVAVLHDSQWASPLGDEIRQALSNQLSSRLNAIDLSLVTGPVRVPAKVYRVEVQRFDMVYGQFARLGLSWRTSTYGQKADAGHVCQAVIDVKVNDGLEPLIAGQREAIDVAAALMALSADGSDSSKANASYHGNDKVNVSHRGCVPLKA